MDKTAEQYEQEIAELKSFYDYLVQDLKHELSEMADKKSMQAAFHNKYRKEAEHLRGRVQQLEEKIISQKETENKLGGNE